MANVRMTAEESLQVICGVAHHLLSLDGLECSCIVAGVLLSRVLHLIGCKDAYLLPVSVRIFNAKFEEWIATHGIPDDEASVKACSSAGGVCVVLGRGAEGKIAADKWLGHLSVIVPKAFDNRHALIDLTLPQAEQPDAAIELAPALLKVTDDFLAGKEQHARMMRRSLLIYTAYPEDHTYKETDAWTETTGVDAAAQGLVEQLRSRGLV